MSHLAPLPPAIVALTCAPWAALVAKVGER